MGKYRRIVNKVNMSSTSSKSIVGILFFLLLLWVIAFAPPIKVWGGEYLYLIRPNIQYYLRAWLYFIMFIGFQAGVFWIYSKIFTIILNNWKKILNIPDLLDKKFKKLVG